MTKGDVIPIPKLPLHLIKLQADIENIVGRSIVWKKTTGIDGEMCAEIQNDSPVICYRQFTEAGAAEELMHLKLLSLKIPRLACPENLHLSKQVAQMLDNLLQHHIIYPVLEKWGYDPKRTECNGIRKQLDTLECTNFVRLKNESALQALFAVVLARGKLDCCATDVNHRLDNLFSEKQLRGARIAGEKVISIIQQHLGTDPNTCRMTLERCLSALGQTNIVEIKG